MDAITYSLNGKTNHIDVKIGRKVVGQIKKVKDTKTGLYIGYRYQPRGSNVVGQTFESVAEVKRSLEA